jgi:hypothetical protein
LFPEGGNLIDGVNAVVAFKATYGNELPELPEEVHMFQHEYG